MCYLPQVTRVCPSPKDGKPTWRAAYSCPTFHVCRYGRLRHLVHQRGSKGTKTLGYNLYMPIISSHSFGNVRHNGNIHLSVLSDTSSIEEAKLGNWDATEEQTLWETKTSLVLLWKKSTLIQLRTFSWCKIVIWSSSEWSCHPPPIWAAYGRGLFAPYVSSHKSFARPR